MDGFVEGMVIWLKLVVLAAVFLGFFGSLFMPLHVAGVVWNDASADGRLVFLGLVFIGVCKL